ncbi:MAG: hypothetical protein P8J14_07335 [Emcibacteraceae bacterium]|nr:hypothetical protein [Emcibacteraceae bacterium]
MTGLVVNEKVNINANYYRRARAMANSFFNHGKYIIPSSISPCDKWDNTPLPTEEDKPSRLEGILQHIHHIRNATDKRALHEKQKKPTATWKLFKKFLFFKYFGTPEKITIIWKVLQI